MGMLIREVVNKEAIVENGYQYHQGDGHQSHLA
jgi:hypothetical protein